MTKEIVLNKKVYRYSNTEHFSKTKNTAHCTIKVQRYVVIGMHEMWRDVKNWDTIDSIIALRNKTNLQVAV